MDRHKLIDEGWKQKSKINDLRVELHSGKPILYKKVDADLAEIGIILEKLLFYLEDPANS